MNGSIGIDLSRNPIIGGNLKTCGTIASIVDGTGSLVGGIF